MFDFIPPPPSEPTDYTGLKIVGLLAPVFFLFAAFGKADMGLTVCIALGAIVFAIKINWESRRYIWFWSTVAFVFLLHIPLFFLVRWQDMSGRAGVYARPLGIIDFFLMSVAFRLSQRLFGPEEE
jgi:hypothetical protein